MRCLSQFHVSLCSLPSCSFSDDTSILYRNDGGSRNHWLQLKLAGTKSNRSGIGATVRVTSPQGKQWQSVHSGSSYCSASDLALTFGPGNLQGLPPGIALACLSETILHALEGTRTNFGVGDDIPVDEADWALALCQRHGFRVAPLHGGDDRKHAAGAGR